MMFILKPKDKEGRTVTLTTSQRAKERERLFNEQKGRCAYCGRDMVLGAPIHLPWACTLDHLKVQPAGCQKDERPGNLVACCAECNNRKGSMQPAVWKRFLEGKRGIKERG